MVRNARDSIGLVLHRALDLAKERLVKEVDTRVDPVADERLRLLDVVHRLLGLWVGDDAPERVLGPLWNLLADDGAYSSVTLVELLERAEGEGGGDVGVEEEELGGVALEDRISDCGAGERRRYTIQTLSCDLDARKTHSGKGLLRCLEVGTLEGSCESQSERRARLSTSRLDATPELFNDHRSLQSLRHPDTTTIDSRWTTSTSRAAREG